MFRLSYLLSFFGIVSLFESKKRMTQKFLRSHVCHFLAILGFLPSKYALIFHVYYMAMTFLDALHGLNVDDENAGGRTKTPEVVKARFVLHMFILHTFTYTYT